ncbi:MAG: hypothetical protein GY707_02115 [Desulfobacteraceae bacterium]|nr:hypothetical protein [Desulfobacteraceae bacterium]
MNFLLNTLKTILYVSLTINIIGCSNTVEYTPPDGSTEMAITHYAFGKMVVDKKEYTGDLAILPEGEIRAWSFDYGSHSIVPNDFRPLITDRVKTFIIGTGHDSAAYLSKEGKEAIEQLRAKGIKVHVLSTSDAVKLFNASSKQGLLACFHLTC